VAEAVSAAKPSIGLQLDHLVAQGLDDAPAAGRGTGRHHQRAGRDLDPGVDVVLRRRPGAGTTAMSGRLSSVPVACAPKIASAMMPMVFCASWQAVGETHVRRRDQLRLAEEGIDPARPRQPREPTAAARHQRR
jgi:hypothetical protein